jgi:hypothetical protein
VPAAIVALGFVAILAELAMLSLPRRSEYALPIGASEVWRLVCGSILAWGPFAMLALLSTRVKRRVPKALLWGGAGLLLALSASAIYGAWTEVEDPGAASIGAGFAIIVEWLASLFCGAMVLLATRLPKFSE